MLCLLGPPKHIGSGSFPSRGYEILAVLSLVPGHAIDRKSLATLIWPDTSDTLALGNLRFVLHAVRQWSRRNDRLLLQVTPTEVTKVAGQVSDLDRFLDTIAPSTPSELSAYVADFDFELLEGHATTAHDFETWLLAQRSRLQQIFVDTVLKAAAQLQGTEVEEALRTAERRAPLDERIIVARVKNLLDYGQRSAAVAAYGNYRKQYLNELGVDLEVQVRQAVGLLLPETLQLATAIQLASTAPIMPAHQDAASASLPRVLILPPSGSNHIGVAQHFVSRALVTEVTTLLGRMRTFAMFAPHTAKRVTAEDPLVAARSIGASYVVSTEVMPRRSENSLSFALIHTASQEILLADRVVLGADPADERLAAGIATAISTHISAVEIGRFRRTGEASAFTHYLLGQERLTYDLKSIRKARAHFRRAATLSPRFAPAHAMIARSLTYEWLVLGREEPDLLQEAHQLAQHAALLDPLLPSGPWEMGHALLYMQRLDESLEQVEAAVRRAPHVADLLADHADVFVAMADGSKAKAAITQAMTLNPISPDEYFWVLATSEFLLEDYAATLNSFNRMANTKPVARLMAACYAMLGDMEAAGHHRDRWLEEYPDFKVEDWVRVIPMRDQHVAQQIVDAMRSAGFR